MSQLNNEHAKESKLWIAGMVGVVIGIILLVTVAIFIQHQQLAAAAATAATARK